MIDHEPGELALAGFAGGRLRVFEVDPGRLAEWRSTMRDPGPGATHVRAPLGGGVLDVIQITGDDDAFARLTREIERAGAERPDLPAFAAFLARDGAPDIGPGAAGVFFEPEMEEPLFGHDRVLDLLVPGYEEVSEAWVVSAQEVLETPRDPIDAFWIDAIERARRARSLEERPGVAATLLAEWAPRADRAIDAFLEALEAPAARGATVLVFWQGPEQG